MSNKKKCFPLRLKRRSVVILSIICATIPIFQYWFLHLAVQYAIGCVNGKAFNLSREKLLHDLKHEGQYYGLLLRFDLYDTKYIHGYII